jgi:hypothetical protein
VTKESGSGTLQGGNTFWFPTVQTGSGDHPASYTISVGVKRPGFEGDHDLNQALRMRGAVPPLFYGVVLN